VVNYPDRPQRVPVQILRRASRSFQKTRAIGPITARDLKATILPVICSSCDLNLRVSGVGEGFSCNPRAISERARMRFDAAPNRVSGGIIKAAIEDAGMECHDCARFVKG
jgi:hypothetical protein